MRPIFLTGLLALVMTACAGLPAIDPAEPAGPEASRACAAVFPREPLRLVHAIRTDLPGRPGAVLLGVIALDPAANTVECALLSIEGLRLFEARHDGTLTVRRALPPFDRPGMAAGTMEDIRLLFFPPADLSPTSGRTPSGEPVCRYALAEGVEDIVRPPSGEIVILRYDGRGRLVRRATISPCRAEGAPDQEALPCRIRLEAFQPARYRLDMELIEPRPAAERRP